MTAGVYFRCVIPIGITFCLNLSLNNIAYQYLTVSFIQMFKVSFGATRVEFIKTDIHEPESQSISPVVVLLSGWLSGLYKVTLPTVISVSLICVGVILSSYGETSFNTLGVIIQFSAVVFEA
ncbi:hypothetical protein ETB97_012308, partial [Aspergillus alliaceus]